MKVCLYLVQYCAFSQNYLDGVYLMQQTSIEHSEFKNNKLTLFTT